MMLSSDFALHELKFSIPQFSNLNNNNNNNGLHIVIIKIKCDNAAKSS